MAVLRQHHYMAIFIWLAVRQHKGSVRQHKLVNVVSVKLRRGTACRAVRQQRQQRQHPFGYIYKNSWLKEHNVMKEDTQKLIENTIKDILLGNATLTFLFAIPLAYIVKSGLATGLWGLTLLVAPSMLAVIVFVISRIQSHATIFFKSIWAKWSYVIYALVSAELLLVYSIVQIVKMLHRVQ